MCVTSSHRWKCGENLVETSFLTSSIGGSTLECGPVTFEFCVSRDESTYRVVTTWLFWSPSLHPPAVAFPAPLTFCPRHWLLHPCFLLPQTQGPRGWKFCRLSVSRSRKLCATLMVSEGDFLADGERRGGAWAFLASGPLLIRCSAGTLSRIKLSVLSVTEIHLLIPCLNPWFRRFHFLIGQPIQLGKSRAWRMIGSFWENDLFFWSLYHFITVAAFTWEIWGTKSWWQSAAQNLDYSGLGHMAWAEAAALACKLLKVKTHKSQVMSGGGAAK